MGEEHPAGTWTLHASVPEDARVVLLRNGEPVAQIEGRALKHEATEPGVYRIEAHRHWRKRERPWIYSNPIYLR